MFSASNYKPQLCLVSEWNYVDMEFTWLEIMLSVAFLSSFVTTVLTSTAWHYINLSRKGELSIWQEVKVVPFFLPAIMMKTFVVGTLSHCLMSLHYPYLVIALVTCLLLYQAVLQKLLGFKNKEVAIASFANLTALARPSTENTQLVRRFFIYETLLSTGIYLLLSSASVFLLKTAHLEEWAGWTCLGLVGLQCALTQIYLHTSLGQTLLFPTASDFEDQTNDEQNQHQAGSKKALKKVGWIFFILSVVITLALFATFGYLMAPKGKKLIPFCFGTTFWPKILKQGIFC